MDISGFISYACFIRNVTFHYGLSLSLCFSKTKLESLRGILGVKLFDNFIYLFIFSVPKFLVYNTFSA